MSLIACGLSHHSAPLALRETLALPSSQQADLMIQLTSVKAANEAVVLSTCNRFEVYASADDSESILKKVAQYCDVDLAVLRPHWYCYQGQAAAQHLMNVASGIDSMVVGESQIVKQVKLAYEQAQQSGTLGVHLAYLFPRVFAVSKQVRSHTPLGASVVSVAYLAVELAQKIFEDLSCLKVLVIGAGETAGLAALHLSRRQVSRFLVASRSQTKGAELASRLGGKGIPLSDIPSALKTVDMVVTATASQLPLVGKGMIETIMRQRLKQPLLVVDLAVPRDVEPEVSLVNNVYLYNMDDLQHMIKTNQACRQRAAEEASQLIALQSEHFYRELQALDVNETIKRFRQQVESLCRQELQKAKKRLALGESVDDVLEDFSRLLIKKLLHKPSVLLKQVAYDGHESMLMVLKALLGVEVSTPEELLVEEKYSAF